MAGADTIKAGLYLINSILFSIYHSLRMTLVMSAYSSPLTEDLTSTWGPLDLRTLWSTSAQERSPWYPVEPMVSQRDFAADSSHPFSPVPTLLPAVRHGTGQRGVPGHRLPRADA